MLLQRPLVSFALLFALGIVLAAQSVWLVACLLPFVLLLAALFGITRRALWGTGLIALAFVLFGSARYLASGLVPSDDVSRLAPCYVTLTGMVASDVRVSPPLQAGQPSLGRFTLDAHGLEIDGASAQSGRMGNAQIRAIGGNVQVRLPLSAVLERSRGRTRETAGEIRESLHYGDALTLRGRLERPTGARNPGDFDHAEMLKRRGIYAMFTVRRRADWHRETSVQAFANPVMQAALRLREAVLQHGKAAHDGERAGVLNGILLGERGDLPGDLNDAFERTGTSHVLATAGLHVGMVVGVLLGCLRVFRIARNPTLALSLLALVLYALMAGGRPSVVRAVVMASVILIGLLLEREPNLPNTLAVAALILLVTNPQNLFEPGFQLSFATVITLVLWMPFATEKIEAAGAWIPKHRPGAVGLRKLLKTLAACFFLALAAQLGAAPLVAYYFNSVSLIGLIANTLIVPLIALVLALGFGAALLGAIHPIFAWPLDRILDGLLAWVIGTIRACANVPYGAAPIASPPVWSIVIGYAVLWGLGWHWRPQPTSHFEDSPADTEVGQELPAWEQTAAR